MVQLSRHIEAGASADLQGSRTLHRTHHHLHTVQMSYAEAVGVLVTALDQGDRQYGAFASGVVRWEVPLPRSVNALHWLQVC